MIKKKEQEQSLQLENNSESVKKRLAGQIASKIETFWGEAESNYLYENNKKREIHTGASLTRQSCIISEHPNLKRKHSDYLPISSSVNTFFSSPLTPESQHENGVVTSDSESCISEQEVWELSNLVQDTELQDLGHDAETPLAQLVRSRYPGYQEDLEMRWEEGEESDDASDWETDSDDDDVNGTEQSRVSLDSLLGSGHSPGDHKTDSVCLMSVSERASRVLESSVISPPPHSSDHLHDSLEPHQQQSVSWLLSAHDNNLPCLMLDDPGLGRKVTMAAVLSQVSTPGPHLIICPVSALPSWSAAFSRSAPALSLITYSGLVSDRRRARDEIFLSSGLAPQVVIVSYKTFFLDSDWFLTRRWSVVVLAEVQNIVSAGSSHHIHSLVHLRSSNRVLMMTGPLRESPIDLWNTLYLLLPTVYIQRKESNGETDIEVEGTVKYAETKEKLVTILKGFSNRRTRHSSKLNPRETRLGVPLNSRKRRLYDDYLAQTFSPTVRI